MPVCCGREMRFAVQEVLDECVAEGLLRFVDIKSLPALVTHFECNICGRVSHFKSGHVPRDWAHMNKAVKSVLRAEAKSDRKKAKARKSR